MEKYVAYVKSLVEQGGPTPEHYDELERKLNVLGTELKNVPDSELVIHSIRTVLSDALTEDTIQGYGLRKPFGYSGDFYMIDKIYQKHVSPVEHLKNWDFFFHAQKAPIAVRNRKQYFLDLLNKVRDNNQNDHLQILNIACGPCRDVCEYLEQTGDKNIHFHCIDYDENAISYAQKVCADYLDHITFYQKNALRFNSNIKFDLAWSAGLLDYFNDKQFKFLLKRMSALVHESAEIIVGNFHPDNPSRTYMEIVGDWYLNYRSEFDLIRLAREAGFCLNDIRVGVEEEYVNLFLHIKRGPSFL